MNKQEWLNIKQTQQIPMELFYEFYLNNNKKETVMNKDEFKNNFQTYVYAKGFIPTSRIVEHYDNLFAITKLTDKSGQLIKEY